jgi:hypothetical protein
MTDKTKTMGEYHPELLDPPLTKEEMQIIRELTGQSHVRFVWD